MYPLNIREGRSGRYGERRHARRARAHVPRSRFRPSFRRLETAHRVSRRRPLARVGPVARRHLTQVTDAADERVVLLLLRPPRQRHLRRHGTEAQHAEHRRSDAGHDAPRRPSVAALLLAGSRSRHNLAAGAHRPHSQRRPVLPRQRAVADGRTHLRRNSGGRRLRLGSDAVLNKHAVLGRQRPAEHVRTAAGRRRRRHLRRGLLLIPRQVDVPRERDVHGPRRETRRPRHLLAGHQRTDERHNKTVRASAQVEGGPQDRAPHACDKTLRVRPHIVRVARNADAHLHHVRRERRPPRIERPLLLHPRCGAHAARPAAPRRRAVVRTRNVMLTAAVVLLVRWPRGDVRLVEAVERRSHAAHTVLPAARIRWLIAAKGGDARLPLPLLSSSIIVRGAAQRRDVSAALRTHLRRPGLVKAVVPDALLRQNSVLSNADRARLVGTANMTLRARHTLTGVRDSGHQGQGNTIVLRTVHN
eukprot:Rhum_TRINITY_DN14383_c1_g1::Rhum_TRINITY_DN14383_c1_g1_i1::g.84003::m.84003